MRAQAYELMERLEGEHWWYRGRRDIVCDLVKRHVPAGSRVVDYGCGAGTIACRLEELGFAVTGAEVSRRAARASQGKGLSVVDLNREALPPRSADCILLCDVLEHLKDPTGLLADLRTALRPGGRLLVTVPAYEFLWSGEDYVSRHHRRYTRSLLHAQVCRAGYRVLWCSHFNSLLLPAIAGVILGKRLLRPRDMYESNVREVAPWLNCALYRVFASERHLLAWFRLPAGASLALVARYEDAVPSTAEG
jgi:SAM-dependent methyltransferase